jgi:cytochrome c oxidase subunit 2
MLSVRNDRACGDPRRAHRDFGRDVRGIHVGFALVGLLLLTLLAACGGGRNSVGTSTTSPPSTATNTNRGTNTTSGAALVAKGKTLVEQGGCGSCHSIDGSSGVGPTWKGLYGSQVELTTGKTVMADERYLITSITRPDAQIVSGYQPGVMAAAVPAGAISEADAAAIAAYIESLG